MSPTEARQKIQELEMRINHLCDLKQVAVSDLDFNKAAGLRDDVEKLKHEVFQTIVDYL